MPARPQKISRANRSEEEYVLAKSIHQASWMRLPGSGASVDAPTRYPYPVHRQSAGRPPCMHGGKSGLHGDTAPDNVRRG